MRAAVYTRVSTRDKGQDTANQLDQLRDFCKAQSWDIVAEYEDHDSGSNPDRTQFKAMLNDAMQRKFDVVLFWALDRFTREGALQTLQYLSVLSSYGVGLRSYTRLNRARMNGTRSGRPIGRPRVIFSRDEAERLRAQGISFRRIATKFGVGEGTIRRAVRAGIGATEVHQDS